MKKENINIKPNIDLNMIQTDKFKMSRLSFSFIYEAEKVASPTRKLVFSTLMRGSKEYPTVTHINRALDDLYGSTVLFRYSSDGDRHIYTFICEMLEEKYIPEGERVDILGGTLKILGDILFNPYLDDDGMLLSEYVENEKKIALDNIRAKINDQRAYSASICKKIMFCGDPASISVEGDEDIVSSLCREDISRAYDEIFSGARIECCYVGSQSRERIGAMVAEFFSKINSESATLEYGYTAFTASREQISREDKRAVTQGRLNIGMTAGTVLGDKDYYAMSLFNEIFGGSSTSKLFMNVREKKSLCYYCSSVYLISKGAIFVSCGVNPENKNEAYAEIIRQLDEMKKGNITEGEIATAKKLICAALMQVSDSPAAIDGFSMRRKMAGVDETPQSTAEKIAAVTFDEIVDAAKRVVPNTVYFVYGEGEEGVSDE